MVVIVAQDIKLKKGYKQTEVGVIPEDWEIKSIGDLVAFSGGSQPPRSTFKFQKKDGYVRLIQIRDYKTDEFETYISEELARKKCTVDDIMIGRYGPPIFQILRGIEGAYNVALLKVIPSSRLNREYLYHFLRQELLFNYVESLSQRSSGQTGIEMPALKSYPFPLPPLPEQQAIATALSDVDALITSLDKLIAKKRDIKQATMQQLLTGRVRLPGFGGEWEVKKLGAILRVCHGKSQWGIVSNDGMYPILATSGEIGRANAYLYNRPSVLIGRKGTINSPQYMEIPFWTIDTLFYTEISDYIDPKFIFYLFNTIDWMRYNEASGVPSLNASTIENIEVQCPPFTEQQAIATTLSDMDAEITALEQRRAKTRALKQGMMQELLTGKTRLLNEQSWSEGTRDPEPCSQAIS